MRSGTVPTVVTRCGARHDVNPEGEPPQSACVWTEPLGWRREPYSAERERPKRRRNEQASAVSLTRPRRLPSSPALCRRLPWFWMVTAAGRRRSAPSTAGLVAVLGSVVLPFPCPWLLGLLAFLAQLPWGFLLVANVISGRPASHSLMWSGLALRQVSPGWCRVVRPPPTSSPIRRLFRLM